MNIIVKDTFNPLVWERVASLSNPLKTNALTRDNRLHRLEALHKIPRYKATADLTTFFDSILKAENVDLLPDVIKFNYNEIEDQGLDPGDVASSVRLIYNLTHQRLHTKPKKFVLSGFVDRPITKAFKDKLVDCGFHGGSLAFVNVGRESGIKAAKHWRHHMDWWQEGMVIEEPQSAAAAIELTYRQQQVLHLIVKRGLKNAQIANELKVSEQAIKLHVSAIMKKYGVRTRTQLALFASAQKI